ncbi:MAG: hypothetical protein JST36_05985 [Bacteroidetes bacterium]|nr:hypothetical protein [Bacteroidota bacterium]
MACRFRYIGSIVFLLLLSVGGYKGWATPPQAVKKAASKTDSVSDSTKSNTIPLEKTLKPREKKRHWIKIVPAKALQGSEVEPPERAIPRKEP